MKKHILSYILIVLGGTMTAAAFGLFILPQNFVAGGVTGLSVILQHGIPLPLSWIVFGINILLFVIGWIFAGKEFILKTLIMTFLFPVLLDVFSQIDLFLPLAKDPFLSSLLSGCLLGIGSGIILIFWESYSIRNVRFRFLLSCMYATVPSSSYRQCPNRFYRRSMESSSFSAPVLW